MSNIIIDPYRFGVGCSANVISCSIKAYDFDGGNDLLELTDDDDFSFNAVNSGSNINTAHSASVYMKRSSASNYDGVYGKGITGNSTYVVEYRVFFLGYHLFLDTYDLENANYSRKSWTVATGTGWFHLAVAFGTTSSEHSAWVNGVSLGSGSVGSGGTSGDMENTTGTFQVGNIPIDTGTLTGYTYHYEGLLTQFMLWKDHKLTQDEVDYLYSSGTALRNPTIDCGNYQISNKLKLWVKEEDGVDHSGNGHNMTLENGLTHSTLGNTPC